MRHDNLPVTRKPPDEEIEDQTFTLHNSMDPCHLAGKITDPVTERLGADADPDSCSLCYHCDWPEGAEEALERQPQELRQFEWVELS